MTTKRFTELEAEERKTMMDGAEDETWRMGLGDECGNAESTTSRRGQQVPAGFGLCSGCKHMQFASTRYGLTVWAKCSEYDVPLQEGLEVARCTSHVRVGSMPLDMMLRMAYIIDPGKKGTAGFNPEGDS